MEQYSDSELEFIRIQICKKYEEQATTADDAIKEIPQYPKSVGDEKFNFLSEYLEETLLLLSQNAGKAYEDLDEFRKENFRINHSLSATLKKLYCEQHYKKPPEERKSEHFKLRSINRFYLYFSGQRRSDFWKEKGATEINKILEGIQSEINAFQHADISVKEEMPPWEDETKALLFPTIAKEEKENSTNTISFLPAPSGNKRLSFYRIAFVAAAICLISLLVYYAAVLRPVLADDAEKLAEMQNKIMRTPALAADEPGLMGTWYSYNRTPETNEENKRKGTIFREIEWIIDSAKNGNLIFSRSTAINENEGWIELRNLQVNFFMDVHPKFGDKNREQNFGFRHFICKPNHVELQKADTLWCVCTSFIHKDGRLDEPLASREIIIRKKEGQVYPTDLMLTDSVPLALREWFPKDKSYLMLEPHAQ